MPENKEIKEFIFVKESIVENEEEFALSMSAFKNKLRVSVLHEREEDGLFVDSTQLDIMLESMMPMLRNQFEATTRIYNHFKLQDSLIISYQKIDDEIIGDYTVIDRNNYITYKLAKKDSIFKYSERPYSYNDKSIVVKEQRDRIKVINGYRCFKISFTDTEDIDDEFLTTVQTQYELYVTDEINLGFHPFFKYKQILSKYYPLEITERDDLIKGRYTIYKWTN